MHDHRHHESARDFLLRRHKARLASARVYIRKIMDIAPSAFLIDPRTGRTFLPPTTESRHYPHGAGASS